MYISHHFLFQRTVRRGGAKRVVGLTYNSLKRSKPRTFGVHCSLGNITQLVPADSFL